MKGKITQKRPSKIVNWLFPVYDYEKHVFAFGDTIYTSRDYLPKHVIVHEMVHLKQMHFSKLFGVIHILLYRFIPKYRYKMEIEAYREQNRYIIKNHKINYAHQLAEYMCGIDKDLDFDKVLKDIINVK